jgi:predicted nucleic acid-binding protein
MWHEGAFELVASYELFYELEFVLLRAKFRRYLTEGEALEYVLWLRKGAILESEGDIRPLSRDPEDDYLLALAATRARITSSPATPTCATWKAKICLR